jgi:hypothetical protein
MEDFITHTDAGNVAAAEQALNKLADAGENPSLFLTLLLHAISRGRHEVFHLFLVARGKFRGLTVADCRAKPFLVYAAGGCSDAAIDGGRLNAKNSAIIVKKLLDFGLNSVDCSANGCNAIVSAIVRGYTETVRLLMKQMPPSFIADNKILIAISFSKAGAEMLDIIKKHEWTRIDYAGAFYNVAKSGNSAVLNKFIKMLASDPEELSETIKHSQAFLAAVQCGHLSMVRTLATHLPPDYCRQDNYAAIHFIANTGSFEMLKMIDEIWGLTTHDYMQTSIPLQMAMMCCRNTEMLDWLLHKGLHAPDHFVTPEILRVAVLHENIAALDWLWERGAQLHHFQVYPHLLFGVRGILYKIAVWDWFFGRGLRQNADGPPIIKWLLSESIRNDALNVVQWLWDRGHITPQTFAEHDYDFMRVALSGSTEFLNDLRTRLPREFFVFNNCSLLRKAINFGNDTNKKAAEWLICSGFNIPVIEADLALSADAAVLDQLIQLGARPRETNLEPWQKNAKKTIKIVLLCEMRLGVKWLPSEVWLYMAMQIW